jgi:hypothetical protein
MDERNRNIIFFILVLIIIALGIWLVIYINSNSYECMSNALSYGIKNLEKQNNAVVSCNCVSWNEQNNHALFSLTSSGIGNYSFGS